MNSRIRISLAAAASAAGFLIAFAISPSARAEDARSASEAQVSGPPPSPAYVWMGGHWNSEAGQWKWVAAHWELPPSRGSVWVAGHWISQGGNWVWVNGAWNVSEPTQTETAPPQPPAPGSVPAGQAVPTPPHLPRFCRLNTVRMEPSAPATSRPSPRTMARWTIPRPAQATIIGTPTLIGTDIPGFGVTREPTSALVGGAITADITAVGAEAGGTAEAGATAERDAPAEALPAARAALGAMAEAGATRADAQSHFCGTSPRSFSSPTST